MNSTRIARKRVGRSVFLVLLAVASALLAQDNRLVQSAAPSSPTGPSNPPPAQTGFPVPLSGAFLFVGSSPTLADLDNNGTLEIIVAGRNRDGNSPGCGGVVYAYHHDGSRFWETSVRAPVNSTPTVADLNGDGYPDVVVSMGGYAENPCWHGGVIALNGRNGQRLWTFDTQDWLHHDPDGWRDGVFSTPAIGDVNADGQPEIVFGGWDQCIYLLNRDGHSLWGNLPGILPQTYCGGHGFYNEDTIWSSPALADVTGDGHLEIIIGADISRGNVWGDPSGGYLYILDADGVTLAREWMDQVIYSSPAVADLDRDGEYEFVVGTGTWLPDAGRYVSAFDFDPDRPDPADRLVLKWRRATGGRVFASPAVADLNGDGWLDVVITARARDSVNDGSFVHAWRGADGAELFKRRVCNYAGQSVNTNSSPTVADVDGDGRFEILLSHLWEVAILNHDGTYFTDYPSPPQVPVHSGCTTDIPHTTELTYHARYTLRASPAVGDLDADGDMEVVIGGHNPDNPNQGMLFAWTGHPDGKKPWPMFHRDARHTGRYPRPAGLSIDRSSIYVLHQSGVSGDEQSVLRIRNTGDEPFSWNTSSPAGVTLSPASGTVVDQAQLQVTVSTTGYADGTHDLGDIVVRGSAEGSAVAGSPARVSVTLFVGQVSWLYLPATLKSDRP